MHIEIIYHANQQCGKTNEPSEKYSAGFVMLKQMFKNDPVTWENDDEMINCGVGGRQGNHDQNQRELKVRNPRSTVRDGRGEYECRKRQHADRGKPGRPQRTDLL